MKHVFFAFLLLVTAGCGLDPDAAEKYKTEKQLEAAITVSQGRIFVETNPKADVSVLFWKEGDEAERLIVKKQPDGLFSAEKAMKENGVYFVRADVKTAGQHLMPTKKIVVGKQAEQPAEKKETNVKNHH